VSTVSAIAPSTSNPVPRAQPGARQDFAALLHQRGVRLFTGSDGVRDTWSPLNNGDMLERAYLLAYKNGFRHDEDIDTALHLATHGGAQVMGAEGYGLDVGCQADLVLVEAQTAAEAVVMHPPRRAVFKRGRLVAGALRS
jgi:cytosine deaminase